jgi:hypothetical protein
MFRLLVSLPGLTTASWPPPPETSVAELQKCRRIMDRVLGETRLPVVRRRLLEDDRNLRYAEATVGLYDLTARAILAQRPGNVAEARRLFEQTVPHVKALRAETGIVASSASHANAADGMAASLIETGWKSLAAQLGVPQP